MLFGLLLVFCFVVLLCLVRVKLELIGLNKNQLKLFFFYKGADIFSNFI